MSASLGASSSQSGSLSPATGLRVMVFEDSYDIKEMLERDGINVGKFRSFEQQVLG
eukprot:CAMPEP_0184485460 /NCGR_PEP_ID=MMETSP0113_2-20130426/7064_1 /TAXON_ID=91329 /ORGANISM="Norrisiella sphaerica, Strain BC52" /LENGTH=55 /DNA_ID=CAMNT_0026866915 /DNA_START=113 /DNA_END=280 /DNA_ORIENTATION=+